MAARLSQITNEPRHYFDKNFYIHKQNHLVSINTVYFLAYLLLHPLWNIVAFHLWKISVNEIHEYVAIYR